MKTIRETLKGKFDAWLDKRCDKGVDTYGHELDDCPDEKFDWRDMLIEELLDGLQYQEKEIRILKKRLEDAAKVRAVLAKHNIAPKESPFEEQYFKGFKPNPITGDPLDPRNWVRPPYADLDD